MATYTCDGCGTNIASVSVSFMGTGDVKFLCIYCLYPFAHTLTMSLDEGPDIIAAMAAPAAEEAPKRGRAKRKPATVDPETGEITGDGPVGGGEGVPTPESEAADA